MILRALLMCVASTAILCCTGCSPYQLQGKVIEGATSAIMIVSSDDPRLNQQGIGQSTVFLTIDPNRLGQKSMPPTKCDKDGTFVVAIDQFGTGFLEYQFGLIVRHLGYDSAVDEFTPPNRNKRVLVVLSRGPDQHRAPEDMLHEAQPFFRK